MLVTSIIRTGKANLLKAFFVIGAITALDDAIAPGTRLGKQGVRAPVFFNGFRESRFPLWVRRKFHRERHRVIRKGYEKGGKLSKAR
jgi:hypothetical protein